MSRSFARIRSRRVFLQRRNLPRQLRPQMKAKPRVQRGREVPLNASCAASSFFWMIGTRFSRVSFSLRSQLAIVRSDTVTEKRFATSARRSTQFLV